MKYTNSPDLGILCLSMGLLDQKGEALKPILILFHGMQGLKLSPFLQKSPEQGE